MGLFDKLRSGSGSDSGGPVSTKKLWDTFFKLVMKKDLKGALSTLEGLVNAEPSNPQVFLKKAEILQRTKDVDGAVAAYYKAAERLDGGERGLKAHAIYKIVLRLKPDESRAKKLLSTPPVASKVQDDIQDYPAASHPGANPVVGSPSGAEPSMPVESSYEAEAATTGESVSHGQDTEGGIELSSFAEGGIELDGGASGEEGIDSGQDAFVLPEEHSIETFEAVDESSSGQVMETEYDQSLPDMTSFAEESPYTGQTDSASDALDWDDVPAGTGAFNEPSDIGAESFLAESGQEAPVTSDVGDALDWGDVPAGAVAQSSESPLDLLAVESEPGKGDVPGTDEGSYSLMGKVEEDITDGSTASAAATEGRIAQLDWGDASSAPSGPALSQDGLLSGEAEDPDYTGGIDIPPSPEPAARGQFSGDEEPDMPGLAMGSLEVPDTVDMSSGSEAPDGGVEPEIDSSLWESPVEVASGSGGEFHDGDEGQDEATLGDFGGGPGAYTEVAEEGDSLPPIFSFLSVEDIESLPERAVHRSYDEGEYVIREGDSSDSMFIIRSGTARVETMLKGRVVRLGGLEQGDFFGEVAFLTGKPRTASVISEGGLEVMEIDRALLQSTIDRNPLVLDSLLDMYKNRAMDAVKRISENT